MAVADNYIPLRYESGTAGVEYPVTWNVIDADTVICSFYDGDILKKELAYGVDYIFEHATEPAVGGKVILLVEIPENNSLVIERLSPYTQWLELLNSGKLDLESLERSLDHIVMLIQQVRDDAERAVRVPPGSSTTVEQFANTILQSGAEATAAASAAATSETNAKASEEAAKASEISAAESAASAAESAHQAGDAAVARVAAEGDTQVARVTTVGGEQVEAVQTVGTVQVQNVENAGLAILNTASQLAFGAFLPGMVVAFSGSFGGPGNLYPIPAGSTEPDMTWKLHEPSRGKFILGGTGQNQKVEGGSETTKGWTLTVNQIPQHTHSFGMSMFNAPTAGNLWPPAGANFAVAENMTYSTKSTGGSQSHSHGQNLPPYYTLAYIEKLNVENPSTGHAVFVTHEEFQEGLTPKADQTSLDELSNNTAQALASQSAQIQERVTSEQLSQTLAQERDVTNQALAGKQGTLTAGNNITITPEGVISSTGGGGGGTGGVDYKTTEQDTGLKALDGSPVYQITISVPSWVGTAAVSHGIVGLTNVYTAKAVVAQGV